MTETTTDASLVDISPQALHLLRQAREQLGMDPAVLAVALKVSVKKIEALEAGRFDELPGNTFARALAASACRHLKIDPAPVLASIPQAESPRLGYVDASVEAPFQGSSLPVSRSVLMSRVAALAALALVVGALLVMFWPATPPEEAGAVETPVPLAAPAAPTAPDAAASPADVPVPVAASPSSDPAAPATSAAAPSAAQPPAAAPAAPAAAAVAAATVPGATTTGAAAPAAADPSASLMSIRATNESWVEVSSVGGQVLLRRLLKTGEVVDFTAPLPYNVKLGRVDAAVVTVRGQPFDATPFARNSVARFEVK